MAVLSGENGTVKYGSDSGGASTAIANVRSWTVDHTKDVIETSKMGDSSRSYISGLHSFTGSMEVIYDDSETGTAVFDTANDSTLHVEFFPTTTGGQKYEGDVIVTSVSRTASFDDLITATVSFQGTGPLIEAAV
jgi:predicted secreted protein